MLRPIPSLLCAFLIALVLPVAAQSLDPLLAPAVDRYNGAVSQLQAAKKSQVAQHEAEYARQLDVAIKTVTDEAKLAVLKKERTELPAGLIAPKKPADFPTEASAARKSFFNGVGKAAFDYAAAKKKLDDAYLKELATISKQAKGKGSPLASQVAAEKRRVTSGN